MKSTNKHVKETAKSARQPAYKTPAQGLEDFKAKVLAMKHGPVIWSALTMYEFDDDRSGPEWTATVLAPLPAMFRRRFPNTPLNHHLGGLLANELLHAAMREVKSTLAELWPEYARLLKRNPDELKAYRERYNQDRKDRLFDAVRPRELRPAPGRPRNQKLAERDSLIVQMRDVGKCTFGKIALRLNIGREVAISAYRRAKHNLPTS